MPSARRSSARSSRSGATCPPGRRLSESGRGEPRPFGVVVWPVCTRGRGGASYAAGGPMKIIEGTLRVAASDVANFLACQELTQLDLRRARGTLRPPHPRDLGFEDLVRRGEEHERGVLERFRADGLEVADLSLAGDPVGATVEAVRSGIAVIYQGTLTGAGGEV